MRVCFTGVNRDVGERAVFDLLPVDQVPGGVRLAEGGSVLDAATYELSLHLDSHVVPVRALMNISGGESMELACTKVALVEGEANVASYRMSLVDRRHPDKHDDAFQCFKLAYGFARVEVELYLDDAAEPLLLTTQDIPCRSQSHLDSANVEAMLADLLDTDDVPSSWMFGCAQGGSGPFAILDGYVAEHSARSLVSMSDLIGRVLDEYERQAGFFRFGAQSRIVQRGKTVPLGAVRSAGRNELTWLARNTGVLIECPEREGVYLNGGWYLPRKVETSVKVKTFDSYENQRVLGFLGEISRVAALLRSMLGKASGEVQSIEERLRGMTGDGSVMPALAIVRAYADRERRFLSQLDGHVSRARSLQRLYASFMPDVQGVFGYTLRRTKVFTEIHPYMRLYGLMREWLGFGDFSLAKEGIALQAAKMDKLYEYFVLHRMLVWLHAHGFAPVGPEAEAIRCGVYESEGFFKPETGVATIYELERASEEGRVRVKLYYQPIIRGSMVEEEGIALHRLSYGEGARSQNYWTPDYLIELTTPEGAHSYHVVDAKYRRAFDLIDGYPKHGELAECVHKYRVDVMGSAGERVSCVWLVAGKKKGADVHYAESSPWAVSMGVGPRSGVATLTVGQDGLDTVFAEVFRGVGGLVGEGNSQGGRTDGAGETHTDSDSYNPSYAAGSESDAADGEAYVVLEPAHHESAHREEGSAPEADLKREHSDVEEAPVTGANAAEDEGPAESADPVVDASAGGAPDPSTPKEPSDPAEVEAGAEGERRGRKRHKPKRAAEKSQPAQPAQKTVRKANLPKRKPEKKRAKRSLFDLDDATRESVGYIMGHVDDPGLLFSIKWAQQHLGLDRPLLRKRKPEGREAGFYEPMLFNDEECWLYTHWTPVQKNRVKIVARTMERKESEEEFGDSDA